MIGSFVAGALVGGLVVWRWREEILRYLDDRTRGVRRRAADQLQSVEETLRAGQDAIRPGPASRD